MSLPVTNTNLYFKIIIIKTEENHDIQEKTGYWENSGLNILNQLTDRSTALSPMEMSLRQPWNPFRGLAHPGSELLSGQPEWTWRHTQEKINSYEKISYGISHMQKLLPPPVCRHLKIRLPTPFGKVTLPMDRVVESWQEQHLLVLVTCKNNN